MGPRPWRSQGSPMPYPLGMHRVRSFVCDTCCCVLVHFSAPGATINTEQSKAAPQRHPTSLHIICQCSVYRYVQRKFIPFIAHVEPAAPPLYIYTHRVCIQQHVRSSIIDEACHATDSSQRKAVVDADWGGAHSHHTPAYGTISYVQHVV